MILNTTKTVEYIGDQKDEPVFKANSNYNNVNMKLRIFETSTPNKWQEANLETSAKRRGKDGDYITHNGDYIFSNTDMILTDSEVSHVLLESDETAISTESKKTQTVEAQVETTVESEIGF